MTMRKQFHWRTLVAPVIAATIGFTSIADACTRLVYLGQGDDVITAR